MLNNNLIIIYGKAGSYKSSIGTTLVNGLDEIACYINLEGNRHLNINPKVKVFNDPNMINQDFIKEVISDFTVVLIDSLDSLNLNKEELIYLKELAKDNKTTLIFTANTDSDEDFKNIADLMIYSKR